MAPLSKAEKWRRYLMKNAETYRKAEALRKREYRKVLKGKNPLTNENRSKIQLKERVSSSQISLVEYKGFTECSQWMFFS